MSSLYGGKGGGRLSEHRPCILSVARAVSRFSRAVSPQRSLHRLLQRPLDRVHKDLGANLLHRLRARQAAGFEPRPAIRAAPLLAQHT